MTSAYSEPWDDLTQRPTMEVMGYSKLEASPPPQAMVLEVERSLRIRPHIVSGSVIYGRGDHDACESFLKFGLQESDFTRKIEEVIGRPMFTIHQGPIIVHSPDCSTDWGINVAHPSRDGVSVFRNLLSDSADKVVTLKLYPISHHLSTTEFARDGGPPRSFSMRPDELLFVRGALKMEISLPAGGFIVWQGFSERPWGLDPSFRQAFAFMRI